MKIIESLLVEGYGVSSGKNKIDFPDSTIKMQKPFFKELGLNIDDCFNGTLNLYIFPYSFEIIKPDYQFNNLKWYKEHPQENFSIIECKIEFKNKNYKAYLYYPNKETKIKNIHKKDIIEIITEKIPNINYNDKIIIHINKEKIIFFK